MFGFRRFLDILLYFLGFLEGGGVIFLFFLLDFRFVVFFEFLFLLFDEEELDFVDVILDKLLIEFFFRSLRFFLDE